MKGLILREHEVRQLQAEGRVTVVRAVKPQPYKSCERFIFDPAVGWLAHGGGIYNSPFGARGDLRYVRETWFGGSDLQDICYKTACSCGSSQKEHDEHSTLRSPTNMLQWMSRHTVRNVSAEVKRVQEITHDEAKGTGVSGDVELNGERMSLHQHVFRNGCKFWDANSWVWVGEFERVEK